MQKVGFAARRYHILEKRAILQRIKKFSRLYLEIGGKLLYDDHAARVLPGYDPKTKVKLIKSLRPCDILYCVNAKDLAHKRLVGKPERLCAEQAYREIKYLEKEGMMPIVCVITRYAGQSAARIFKEKLKKNGIIVYIHHEIPHYLKNPKDAIIGFAQQPYIPVHNKLTIVTGVASGSGKMAVALSQIYHERKNRERAGFAKVETFPVWNLPITHPINLAYEAATADLGDKVVIDSYYKRAYNQTAVNYNRDIANFAILKRIAAIITKKKEAFGYRSPTDMGISKTKEAITNDSRCQKAARQEIVHRYYDYLANFRQGKESLATIRRMKHLLKRIKYHIPKEK